MCVRFCKHASFCRGNLFLETNAARNGNLYVVKLSSRCWWRARARAHALQQSWMSFYVSEWQIRLSSFKLAKSFSGNSHRYKTRSSGRQSTAALLCIPGRADFILIQLSKIFEVLTETACVRDLWFLRVRSWEDSTSKTIGPIWNYL